jgi:glycosyltransferase involved in cell wall biosynthesis
MPHQPDSPAIAQESVLPTIVVNHMLEPPGQVTGITRFLFSMLQGLLETSVNKIVLVTSWQASQLPETLARSRLQVVSVPHHAKLSINVAMQGPVLSRLMRQHAPAVEFNANPLGFFAGSWPRIITVHDLYLKLLPAAYPKRHRLTWNLLFPLSARNADVIVVPSESTRADLARYHPGAARKALVVPEAPAFDLSSPLTGPPAAGRYGLIVGNLSPNKNAGVVVEALARLEREGIVVPVIHIGRDEHGILTAAQRQHRLAAPIVTKPGVSDGALRSAYANAAFFLNTSLHEGFCLPIVEAQFCGAPVIASNRSALPEVAGDGALLVDPVSARDVAAAIKSLWTDETAAKALAALGQRNVARFSWDKAAQQLLEAVYRANAESGSARAKPAIRPDAAQPADGRQARS